MTMKWSPFARSNSVTFFWNSLRSWQKRGSATRARTKRSRCMVPNFIDVRARTGLRFGEDDSGKGAHLVDVDTGTVFYFIPGDLHRRLSRAVERRPAVFAEYMDRDVLHGIIRVVDQMQQ